MDEEGGLPEELPNGGEGIDPSSYLSVNDPQPGQVAVRFHESRLLLHPSFDGRVAGWLLLVLAFCFTPNSHLTVSATMLLGGKNMTSIAALKFDASFEILLSISNPSRVKAELDRGKGSYSFEGKQFGMLYIPPVAADATSMAINEVMPIAHVSPDQKQALQLLEACYMGKLILEAEFEGTVRILQRRCMPQPPVAVWRS